MRLLKTGCAPVAGVLALLLAAVLTLTGCTPGDVDGDGDTDICTPPLACGPMYPVAYYPWVAHPYVGYLHDPAHVVIVHSGSSNRVTYRPYSPPVNSGFRPVPNSFKQPAAAKPAAPKPAAPKPAAPKVSAPKVATRK